MNYPILNFDCDLSLIKGIGKSSILRFRRLGISNVGELLKFYPRAYEDWSKVSDINSACGAQEKKIIKVEILEKCKFIKTKNKKLYKILAKSSENLFVDVLFFNSKASATTLEPGETFLLMGIITKNRGNFEIICPKFRNIKFLDRKIFPIYSQVCGLPSWRISNAINNALKLLPFQQDALPEFIVRKYSLVSFDFAIRKIHFPENKSELEFARRRLAFGDLLVWRLAMERIKKFGTDKIKYNSVKIKDFSNEFIKNLPFKPTGAQIRVIKECTINMKSTIPMRRMLQGDVGSGKTAVAATLAYNTVKSGFQVSIMVPTEILAFQHYENFKKMMPDFEEIYLITGSTSKKKKNEIIEKFLCGIPGILVGTQSLISEGIRFKNLALAITDEQHRFGVGQRSKLAQKGNNPHTLVISATPIPRSLALVLYGDMDFSVIDEFPPGRKAVQTFIVSSEKRGEVLKFLELKLRSGTQAYVVCAAIEPDPDLQEPEEKIIDVENYRKDFLTQEFLNEFKTEIVHSKIKSSEKEKIMKDFCLGITKLLISTTVIEVGLDVPNASLMIIENAERFGLAVLHQLRGRVGRGTEESYCILISDKKWGDARVRLKAIKTSNDGFFLANQDLKLRGPGEFFGKRQHGALDPRLASALRDAKIVEECILASHDLSFEETLPLAIETKIETLIESI
ncbi:MAG: ATP-dependent DNA helicase RecG [Oscillospiraceae bacterium]|jgi:ATP-dependent DNA helicase RecG|nr:ATP-dependent DNA helicase RecG [Oscillospiraceae bacterium]